MDNAKFAETRQWLIKSQRDLKAAYVLLNNEESLLDAVVYHCQQAAEKALKAYLTRSHLKMTKRTRKFLNWQKFKSHPCLV
ncbi:HEPN domain-containing protein [Dolichospermum planctonicum CS-1226]|uniref:HEPN domain-containing protein n=1 Tax=Dolichospermum planctonicum CS-1226 TaxID=3021751 RepID=A0ABT5AEL0_9CYAN|nr:HEPN domain-containing protein [Dolichospermum planctonicum]MDB9535728.1 HEPN domain-containing protein [Dolichospermum planctonicum CS-1226]